MGVVVVGVDGSGRTHRLAAIAAGAVGVVWVKPPVEDLDDLGRHLDGARADGRTVLVDDAHRLPAAALRALTAAARQGVEMVIVRRPTIDQPDLAHLDEVVASRGGVERLTPLDQADIAQLLADVTGERPAAEQVTVIHTASAGMPWIAAALAACPPGEVPPALAARVQRWLATRDPATRQLARVLALRLELPDAVAALACDITAEQLSPMVRDLREHGMLMQESDAMIPAIADAVLADLSPTERRRVHNDVAQALLTCGADPLAAATQLRAGHALGPMAAEVYRAAGDRLRFSDPDAALRWFAEASEAGADPWTLAAGRAEAAAMLGHPFDLGTTDAPVADAARLGLVAGAVEAQEGRWHRAADTLLAAGSLGRVLAVPALVAVGRLGEAERIVAGEAETPRALHRLAEAVLATRDPVAALPLFIEAAEATEQGPPAVVLPDTPHALGALLAVTAGDANTGVHLLDRALAAGVGGPVAEERHRLLRAWVRLRIGRYDTALAELPRMAGRVLPGRDRLLVAAIAAGLARRSGDIARMRESWAQAEHQLARRTVDLFHMEVLEELVVASARVGELRRASATLEALQDIVDRLARPPVWSTAIAWVRLQAAVAGDDADRASAVAAELAVMTPAEDRPRALCLAARCWAEVLGGRVELDEVMVAADALITAELPWEASRLAGQAAIRTTDPSAARRLLERARDLTHVEPSSGDRPAAKAALLSERELEVAKLVLAGRTHKEIGGQLYVSPKTVEHHVARIRTKLGVSTRADFIAALRELLETDIAANPSHEPPNAVS